MDIDTYIRSVLDGQPPDMSGLNSENAAVLADRLKAEAERYFRIDPNISLCCADAIIQVGKAVNSLSITALGTMARGDGLGVLDRLDEAWQMFSMAADIYQEIGDEIGWARTCIGRLLICVEMNSIETALQDAKNARAIFLAHEDYEKLVRLDSNEALILNYLCEYQTAIEKCQNVLRFIEANGEFDASKLTVIYYVLGQANQGLGNLRESQHWYEQSRERMLKNGEKFGAALVDLNLINIAQAQGHHKKALQLLHGTIDVLAQHLGGKEMVHVIDGYLFLNRFNDARELALKVIEQQPANQENDNLAFTLLQLAKAEVALGDFSRIFSVLDRAEQIFTRLDAFGWLSTLHLFRGQVAFQQGDLATARFMGQQAAEQFHTDGQQVSYLTARLLIARVELADGHIDTAIGLANIVQKKARKLHIPHLRYEAHVLLGRAVEQTGNWGRALRHYQIAAGIMEHIQRSLVLTARAEFLADKQESVGALVRLNLELGRTETAFTALEHAKAQVWLGYLSQLDHLRWLRDDPEIQPLIDELTRLREEHHNFYRMAHDLLFREQQHITMPLLEAAHEAGIRERRLSALTEQLYLYSSVEDLAATAVVSVSDIQAHLHSGTRMIAYYSDGTHWWAFVLDSEGLDVYPLPETAATIAGLLDKWQANVNRALRTTPGSTEEKMLQKYATPLLERLYDALIRPFSERLDGYERLVIVPYGVLHYLPFQLLHDGENYLINRAEIVTLPTASLITRQSPRQTRSALALSYSWDGRLHYTAEEARRLVNRFGGKTFCEEEATQSVLENPPCQVLHISAHGQYRIDQPDFSYIQLAHGPLYTDDLFQHDLRYELVTLSACETGRSRAFAGDELIGLGRGFLFAGAGALVASLWRVNETLTLELMDEMYRRLDSGASKAAALREAQLALMRAYPGLHPAFWGAFELIGNADPLTNESHFMN